MIRESVEECRRVFDVITDVHGVLGALARRWNWDIVIAGLDGARRFGEYRRMIDGVSDRMLAQRLKELEELGLLSRTVVPSTPVQVLHAPTEHAEKLMRAIDPLVEWGEEHAAMVARRS